jgi:Lon-like protease
MHRETDLPEPPDVRPVSASPWWKGAATLLVVVVLAAAAFNVPLPMYYGLVPGPVHDVEKLVDVEGATSYSSEGALYLTTVSIDESVTFADWVRTAFDPATSVVPRESITGGLSGEAYRREQRRQMQLSKLNAEEVVLSALGMADGEGAVVTQTVSGSPAAGVLERDDVISAVNGRPVDDKCQVISVVRALNPGDSLEVELLRGGSRKTFDLVAGARPGEPGVGFLGVAMKFAKYEVSSDVEVSIDTGRIGGPSAGIMFALALYDRLTPEDLTMGREIAGSGEILECGFVGPIGGVEHKVAAAEDQGAEIFIAPVDNAEAAESAAADIDVVAVETFDDAVEYLEGLD